MNFLAKIKTIVDNIRVTYRDIIWKEMVAYMDNNMNCKVLIVDDMRINRMILASLLASKGVESDLCESGQECIELVERNDYDLILLDHRMPELDGVDTLVRLKAIFKERGRNIPIVCHTTKDGQDNINLYKAAGFADVLIKPIQPQELFDILMEYLPNGHEIIRHDAENLRDKQVEELGFLPAWTSETDGIDTMAGIAHCETAEDYIDALCVFANGVATKADEIERYYEEKDYQMYALKVHSLKSMTRLIGATELSKEAALLEIAAKDRDEEIINEHNDKLLIAYRKLGIDLAAHFTHPDTKSSLPKADISEATLSDAYTAISEFATCYDSKSIQIVIDSLLGYNLSKEDEDKINRITEALNNSNWESLRDIVS